MFTAKIFCNNEKHIQKCCVPTNVLRNSDIKAADIVLINNGDSHFICRIFPTSNTEPEKAIIFDTTVQLSVPLTEKNFLLNNLEVLKTSIIERVTISVILKNDALAYFSRSHVPNIISKLLNSYVIGENVIIHCHDRELAVMFGICRILVHETDLGENVFGKITRTATVEIKNLMSEEHYKLSESLKNLHLGGIKFEKKILEEVLKETCKAVIITGPSGCGKSTLGIKFCCDIQCHLMMIDGRKQFGRRFGNCKSFPEYFTSFNESSQHNNIIFIDHIDEIVPSESNVLTKNSSLSLLAILLQKAKQSNVIIISTAVQKKNIHPAITHFFEKEISLGAPSFDQQKDILEALLLSHLNHSVDVDKIARKMPGFIAKDIHLLKKEAIEIRNKKSQVDVNVNESNLTTCDFEEALQHVTPSIVKLSKWKMNVQPVHWEDIGGMEEVKKRLQMCIEQPLLHPDVFERVDLRCPKGLLLFGPPGCCKTTLARGLATECNANFFSANPSHIYSPFVGESEKNISQLFYEARVAAPSIIFLDELDSLVGNRTLDNNQQGVAEKVLSTLLTEMDGIGIKMEFEDSTSIKDILPKHSQQNKESRTLRDEVIVVAATNRPDCIDSALLRPGRLDMILYIPPPNYQERVSILKTLTQNMPLNEVDLEDIASQTIFFTGADLKNLCNMAAVNALDKDIDNAEYISKDDFSEALQIVQPSVTSLQVTMYEQLAAKYGPAHFT